MLDRRQRLGSPLQGEDLRTERAADARHWIGIYSDLVNFKISLLDRVRRDLPKLDPVAQTAAQVDVQIIQEQQDGYHGRLRLWYQRLWDLQGVWLDAETRTVRHGEKQVVLTKREFQLLSFLLKHPNRFFASEQIAGQAWADAALFPDEVRNYVSRLRKVLASLRLPCDLVNRPGRGYSLVFRPENDSTQ